VNLRHKVHTCNNNDNAKRAHQTAAIVNVLQMEDPCSTTAELCHSNSPTQSEVKAARFEFEFFGMSATEMCGFLRFFGLTRSESPTLNRDPVIVE
jgi:hypothetical protein